jgi:hypothetical protein
MNPSPILAPFAGMLLLTLVVFVVMFVRRVSAIQAKGIEINGPADLEQLGEGCINSSANFQNLFEVPVVFYAVVLGLVAAGAADSIDVACAWGFLVFRIAHSAVHCTYNNIMHRFGVYMISCLFVWTMVVRFALRVMS